MLCDKEISKIELATLYELRLILLDGEKKEYTLEEILELLDKIAIAKK